jgi:hypothetical protein
MAVGWIGMDVGRWMMVVMRGMCVLNRITDKDMYYANSDT